MGLENKVLNISYTLREKGDDKIIIDKSPDDGLFFILGHGYFFNKMEETIFNMEIGESTDVVLSPDDAFGHYFENMVMEHKVDNFFKDISEIDIERIYEGLTEDNEIVNYYIESVNKDKNTFIANYNHPYAGMTLEYSITLNSAREATDLELTSGEIQDNYSKDGCRGKCD